MSLVFDFLHLLLSYRQGLTVKQDVIFTSHLHLHTILIYPNLSQTCLYLINEIKGQQAKTNLSVFFGRVLIDFRKSLLVIIKGRVKQYLSDEDKCKENRGVFNHTE